MTTTAITVETIVNAPVEKVWKYWTQPEHIIKWNFASDDWHCPSSTNDLRVGGKFSSRMAAKDGSMAFDFAGEYIQVKSNEYIEYVMGDGRNVKVFFSSQGTTTKVTSTFEAESINSIELQKGGWQAIIDNFKKHTESN